MSQSTPLAIVGISCIFPKADDLRAYWANIKNGVDAITPIPATHWKAADFFNADPKAPDLTYAQRGGFLPTLNFNPMEYGIAPKDIEATDTTQLFGMVAAKQALADAGYADKPFNKERTSVILGVTGALELVIPLGARLGHPIWRRALKEAGIEGEVAEDIVQRIADGYVPWQENSFPGLLGNVAAGRIASRLDLGGTNCVVDAACASSMAALHLAALELETGRSDMVITGGVDTFNDIFMYMCFSKTPALSPTGDAKPFDKNCDGTILGEGLGMLVLKRLADAERDGDRIYCVIKGIGSSSDGRGGAIYEPRSEGQQQALTRAYANADASPETIDLIEAHGTGTKVGDATEVRSLTEVFRAAKAEGTWAALGSVKSQIGHTKAAAGIAGLIKAALALDHKVLPPTIKVNQPLDEAAPGSPFYVNTTKRPWLPRSAHARRAGVSAFGFGGTNFHCVLEEHGATRNEIGWDGDVEILAFAADTRADLRAQLAALPSELPWLDLRQRAHASRQAFRTEAKFRLLVPLAKDASLTSARDAALSALDKDSAKTHWSLPHGTAFGSGPAHGKLAFLFPGQGSQYAGMFRDLACQFPEMLAALTEADAVFAHENPTASPRLSDFIYPHPAFSEETRRAQDTALKATELAQPALGAVSLGALGVIHHFGVTPTASAGHSYGELPALHTAGRLNPASLHQLSNVRGRLMAARAGALDRGGMLAVIAPEPIVTEVLAETGAKLVIANRNSPGQFVLAGPLEDIAKVAAELDRRSVRSRVLQVSAAFHSPLVADAKEPFAAALKDVEFAAGTIPVYANATAAAYPSDVSQTRDLLARQLVSPVDFTRQIEAMHADGVTTFLELGPGRLLSDLVQAILPGRDVETIAVDASRGTRNGTLDLAIALCRLASLGHTVNLKSWEIAPSAVPTGKPAFSVPISGANVRTSKARQRAPVASKPTAVRAVPAGTNAGAPAFDIPLIAGAPAASLSIAVTPTPLPPDLAAALQTAQQGMLALQKLQEQTAQLHQQFLAGQEAARRTLENLLGQRRELIGLAPASTAERGPTSRATPPPAAAQPSFASAPPKPAASLVPLEREGRDDGATAKNANSAISTSVIAVVSEKTGYPAEMLTLDMGLDSDLGIDSIKRVEIMAALRSRLPEVAEVKPEHIGSLRTLQEVVDFLTAGARTPAAAATAELPLPTISLKRGRPGSAAAPSSLSRRILRPTLFPTADIRPHIPLAPGSLVWLTDDATGLTPALAKHLEQRGLIVRRGTPTELLADRSAPLPGALVLLWPAANAGDAFLKSAFRLIQVAAPALRAAGRNGAGALISLSRLDGLFGFGVMNATADAVSGGLAGLVKTAHHEWPEVHCKALDLDPGAASGTELAGQIAEEIFRAGPVEVGLFGGQRYSLEIETAAALENPAPALQRGDLVVVTGGARGVTATSILELARRHRPRFLLLGRSSLPDAEPHWLAGLTSEADIKKALLAHADGDRSPKKLEAKFRETMAQREIRSHITEISAAGALAHYTRLDVRDAAAVAATLAEVRATHGPIRGLIHGAGVLADKLIEQKTEEQFDLVYDTKVHGLRNLFAATAADELRLIALFSSYSGRFGRTGQVDYAAANEIMNKMAQAEARRRPQCRVVAFNWGPWNGGMVTEGLRKIFERESVGLIEPEAGADFFVRDVLAPPGEAVEVLALATAPAAVKQYTTGNARISSIHAQTNSNGTPSFHPAFDREVSVRTLPCLVSHVMSGRAVLPAALIIEWLAHGALHGNPGLSFHGFDGFKVLKGLVLEGDATAHVIVSAAAPQARAGLLVVPVQFASRNGNSKNTIHATAEILLADYLPAAPDVTPAVKRNGILSDKVYGDGRLFHGPDFQCIEALEVCGPANASALVRSSPAPKQMIAQPLRPAWLADPLALDAAFQLMILWSTAQRAAPSLPCALRSFRQFAAFPKTGGSRVVARITSAETPVAVADLQFFDRAGGLVALGEGYEFVVDANLREAFRHNSLPA